MWKVASGTSIAAPRTPVAPTSETIPDEPTVDIVDEQTSTVDKDANLTLPPLTLSLAYPKSDQKISPACSQNTATHLQRFD
jgi:hypothetical protein